MVSDAGIAADRQYAAWQIDRSQQIACVVALHLVLGAGCIVAILEDQQPSQRAGNRRFHVDGIHAWRKVQPGVGTGEEKSCLVCGQRGIAIHRQRAVLND